MSIDPGVREIATRVIKNAQWASLYLAYFEGSNRFLRSHHPNLDGDAHELLNVLDRGLPRLSALCLCRLWDLPKTDRHSLPALLAHVSFAKRAGLSDPSFVKDCRRLLNGDLLSRLREFRKTDLAHNLPIEGLSGGFTVDQLRAALRETHIVVDRMVAILKLPNVRQDEIFRDKLENCTQFWRLVEPRVRIKRAAA